MPGKKKQTKKEKKVSTITSLTTICVIPGCYKIKYLKKSATTLMHSKYNAIRYNTLLDMT